MAPSENTPPPHDLPRTILRLPCYEPAGAHIEFTGEALTRNTLLTGAIGCGKTSTLNRMLSQLIEYRADEADSKLGLLVFDFKDDGTADRVRTWARQNGREADVEELSAQSDTRLELFDAFTDLAQLEEITESLLSACPPECGENQYWEMARRKRLETALGVYRLVQGGTLYGPDVLEFVDAYISSGSSNGVRVDPPKEIPAFERIVEALIEGRMQGIPEQLEKTIIRLDTSLTEWKMLDPRTRSNEQSTLTNLLQSYMGYAAYDFFGGRDRRVVRVEDVIDSGKILVLSVSALRNPKLASTLGRWLKSRFFAHLHTRQLDYGTPGRMAGLIMDEYPLVATGSEYRFSDVTHLQAMRAMRGFTIAATQGFEALNRVLGVEETSALLAQFDQHFFFKSRERAVASLAESLWGREAMWQPSPGAFPSSDAGAVMPVPRAYSVEWRARVGIAELARLQPGEAWVWTTQTQTCPKPHWLVPLHQNGLSVTARKEPAQNDWEESLRRVVFKAVYESPLKPPPESELADWEDFYPSELKGGSHDD